MMEEKRYDVVFVSSMMEEVFDSFYTLGQAQAFLALEKTKDYYFPNFYIWDNEEKKAIIF